MDPGDFIEVFVDAPLAVCEHRDRKGLYCLARLGQLSEFTGVSAPYEPPANPEITIRTDLCSAEQCVVEVVAYLEQRRYLPQAGVAMANGSLNGVSLNVGSHRSPPAPVEP
jgi:adenylylsulfate kinase-like enzyme